MGRPRRRGVRRWVVLGLGWLVVGTSVIVALLVYDHRELIAAERALPAEPIETPVCYFKRDTQGLIWDWHRGILYEGRALRVAQLPTYAPAAAYYPVLDLLLLVEPNGRVGLHRRVGGQLVKAWSWEPDEPLTVLLEVSFTRVPGLVYLRGRNWSEQLQEEEKETEQAPHATTFRVVLGPHAWDYHALQWPPRLQDRWTAYRLDGLFRLRHRAIDLYPPDGPRVRLELTDGLAEYSPEPGYGPTASDGVFDLGPRGLGCRTRHGFSIHARDGAFLRWFAWDHGPDGGRLDVRTSILEPHDEEIVLTAWSGRESSKYRLDVDAGSIVPLSELSPDEGHR